MHNTFLLHRYRRIGSRIFDLEDLDQALSMDLHLPLRICQRQRRNKAPEPCLYESLFRRLFEWQTFCYSDYTKAIPKQESMTPAADEFWLMVSPAASIKEISRLSFSFNYLLLQNYLFYFYTESFTFDSLFARLPASSAEWSSVSLETTTK